VCVISARSHSLPTTCLCLVVPLAPTVLTRLIPQQACSLSKDEFSKYSQSMQDFLNAHPVIVHASLSHVAQHSCVHVAGPSDEKTDHTTSPPNKRAQQSEDDIVGIPFWEYTGQCELIFSGQFIYWPSCKPNCTALCSAGRFCTY